METGFTRSVTDKIKNEIKKIVINQDEMTNLALAAMLSGGHVLLEGVPGLAKTLWVRALAASMSVEFKRTQFTSDLMPTDIIGTSVFNMKTSEFELKKGPLFTNLYLADEINRTPPKTQSALLEVMEERSITIDGTVNKLQEPFMVFATQNPLEFEGTYPLPEALVDRFMMKIRVTYPGVAAEKKMLQMYDQGWSSAELTAWSSASLTAGSSAMLATRPGDLEVEIASPENSGIQPVCSDADISLCKEEIRAVRTDDSVLNYIVSIVETTRRISAVSLGASPRGSVSLLLASKAYAAMNGRDFVIPDDIKDLALPILRHRIMLKPEAEIDGLITDKVIENILAQVKVPR